jgi:GT2 family glycosyltransferase/2-polyprenyl-3-methyl-5-hydroxy-6-metoxy-1,4-benzoquinol methylase
VPSKYSVDIDPEANTSHALMLRLIGGSKHVLDVGCAAGDLARALVERGCRVAGVEIDEEAAEAARPVLDRLVIGDLASLDLASELGSHLFDVVVFGDVLEHLIDPLPVLRQARALLAPGGYVVISIPNVAHADVRLALLVGDFTYRPLGLLDKTHVRFFTRRSLYELLAEAGLAPADVRRTVAPPFGTEIQVPRELVPEGVLERLLEDPDAETYQFVLSAVPDDAAGLTSRLHRNLEAAMGRVEELQDHVAAIQSERAALEAQQHEREAHLAEQVRALEPLTREVERLRRRLAMQDAEGAVHEERAAELERVVRRQSDEIRAIRDDLETQSVLRQDAQERVAAMLGSTAWRVTSPVRALGPLRAAVQGPVQTRRSLRDSADPRKLARRVRERGVRSALNSVRATLAAPAAQDDYLRWVAQHDTLDEADRTAVRRHVDLLPRRPLLSVVVPAYNTNETALREALDSVLGQLYPEWELCVVDDASPEPLVWQVLQEYAARDRRVRVQRRADNGGIAAATNDAISAAQGEYVVLLDHDDILPPHALYMIALEVLTHPDADLVYSDEDKLDAQSRRTEPNFKPDFNHELLLGQNTVSHLGVYRTSLLRELGGMREGVDGSQDHDLALRVVAASSPDRIRHIPHVLYHWRQFSGSGTFSATNSGKAAVASRGAVQAHLEQRGEPARVEPDPLVPTWNRVVWPVPEPAPEVTVVIPTRDRVELLRTAVHGVLEQTDYPAVRVVVVDNDSSDPATLGYLEQLSGDPRAEVLRQPGAFNYSALNNAAVRVTGSPLVLLLNNDIVVRDAGWLREMVSLVVRPGVGAVGAKLLYGDGRVQHGGVLLGILGVANHAHLLFPGDSPGYFGRAALLQEMSAVTGACLLTRREVYEAVGGLDEENLPVAFNDVDFCLRVREAGHRVLWTPHAVLTHLESISRGSDTEGERLERFEREIDYMKRTWGRLLRSDPAYNPNLSITATDFSLADPPRRSRPWAAYYA